MSEEEEADEDDAADRPRCFAECRLEAPRFERCFFALSTTRFESDGAGGGGGGRLVGGGGGGGGGGARLRVAAEDNDGNSSLKKRFDGTS